MTNATTLVEENVQRLAAGMDAGTRAAVDQLRWSDRIAFAVAIVFLLVGITLGLVWTGTAGATTHPNIADAVLRAEAPIIRHNRHLHGVMTARCELNLHRCIVRAYSRAGRLRLVLHLSYRHVRPHRSVMFEDYTGWTEYRGHTEKIETVP